MKNSLLITLLFLAGCANSYEQQAKVAQFNATIPQCETENQCRVMWEMAQIWVNNNSGYKIQMFTDSVIETFNSNNTDLAVTVNKIPIGSGRYEFRVKTWCGNFLGCFPNSWDAAIDFNRSVSSVSP